MVRMAFEPRTAIVTGSDSGIGRATAVTLAATGIDVGVTWHRDREGAEGTASEVRGLGRRAEVAQLDTADLRAAGDVIDDLADRLGGVDVFVNNSGTGLMTPFLDVSLSEWRQVVAVDLDGAFVCIQRAARRMVTARRGGRIIAITSVHEHAPRVNASAYVAAKHGLGGLIKNVAQELGRYGITANAVAPGEIATPMTGQEDEDPRHGTPRAGIPIARPGDAREIASVVRFLVSNDAAYVTGASWVVDGGMLLMGPQGGSHLPDDSWREG